MTRARGGPEGGHGRGLEGAQGGEPAAPPAAAGSGEEMLGKGACSDAGGGGRGVGVGRVKGGGGRVASEGGRIGRELDLHQECDCYDALIVGPRVTLYIKAAVGYALE